MSPPRRPPAPRGPVRNHLHDDALAVLRAWSAPDPEQERLRARFVAHLESVPDGMWRSSYPEHLTAGALVVDANGDRVLL
ncbi:MAG TPA: NUDIX hydrolase, partial [Nocardioides sp.]|nr:NUDIX hydrolase [Nocardioides sp.]